MEAIVLCGGLGTRLKSVIKNIPKPMAPVNDKPFLEYIFVYLKKQGIEKIILAVSYKYEIIKEYFKDEFMGIKVFYSIEKEPLGTGGAIKQALNLCDEKEIFVVNGDTFFDINLRCLSLNGSKICLALKSMQNFDRYGAVKFDDDNFISKFEEKKFYENGFINGGIYLIAKDIFADFKDLKLSQNQKFSFEDFLQSNFKALKARAEIFDDYFIDIGIPVDYETFCLKK